MRNRRFGVEIEFDIPAYGDGEEIEALLEKGAESGKWGEEWVKSIHDDGSSFEIDSPILQGPAGFAEVRRVMNALRTAGCSVTCEDGLHIHHDAPEFVDDMDKVLQLVLSWKANQELIYRFVDRERAREAARGENDDWSDSPCPAWDSDKLLELRSDADRHLIPQRTSGKYWRNDLNISALPEHGTIEIRLHEGTLNPDQAEAWIRFGQAFLNKVVSLKTPMMPMRDCQDLLRRINATAKATERLLARAA